MERKTTQRIIGILVMMALVIILLPLLLDKNEASTQTAAIKPPPFPDQPASPVSSMASNSSKAETIEISPDIANKINRVANASSPANLPANVTEQKVDPAPVVATAQPQANTLPQPQTQPQAQPQAQPVAPQPGMKLADASPIADKSLSQPSESKLTDASNAPLPIETIATPVAESAMQPAIPTTDAKPLANLPQKLKALKTTSSHANTTKEKHVVKTASSKHMSHPMLINNKMAWALQLGSFKNKDNAIRLADKLRTAGYKAFMHEVRSPKGSVQTRVYIGPEYKQASAAKLSSQLEEKMNLHGFVVPFKPLAL